MDNKIFYVTKAKLQELKKEHEQLIELERNKIVGQEAPKVLESDDLNADFVTYQEDMDSLRGRIAHLAEVIERHEIIKKPVKSLQEVVLVGATVTLESAGKKDKLTVMGTLEADPNIKTISNESPLGKAILGRKVGDEVLIPDPVNKTYKIKNISYEIG